MNNKINKLLVGFLVLLMPVLQSCGNDPKSVTFGLAELGQHAELHTEHQAGYIRDNDYNSIGKYAAFASKEGYTKPIPVKLTWDVADALDYTVEISEEASFEDKWTYQTTEKNLEVYNLKVNTDYYWRVSARYPSNTFLSNAALFKTTSAGLRNIYLDGVDNVRDIGGYPVGDGKRVKQGMLYRSAQLNEDNLDGINTPLISEDGLKMNKNYLGIKTDIDLRKNVAGSKGTVENSKLNVSPLGDDVQYKSLPMYYDGQNMLEHTDDAKKAQNLKSIKNFFTLLADEDSYPMVYHCVQGKDRTGLLSYLVGGLLGVDEDLLYKDYLFTNFSTSVGSPCKESDIMRRYGLTISKVEGATLSEKVFNYLNVTLGVSKDTLDAVKNILID